MPGIATEGAYDITDIGLGWIGTGRMFFDASSSASGAYPPHSRPRFWHLMQPGFVSSHFTRRCLYGISKGDLSESNEVRSASFALREVGSLAR